MSFDAHTHLDFPALDPLRDAVVKDARVAGISGWVIAATEPKHWDRVIRIARETGGTPLLGIHPWWAQEYSTEQLQSHLAALSNRCPRHGLGEIGLDYVRARPGEERDQQMRVFRAQLALAREIDRPVAIHCVRAHSDLLHTLKTDGLPKAGGMLHGWSGGPQYVASALALGLFISFGPSLLNPKRRKVRESALLVPTARTCLETDSPDQPLNGKTLGTLQDLHAVAIGLAQLRKEPVDALWSQCGDNAQTLWRVQSG